MKKYIILLALFIYHFSFSQNKNDVKLEWTDGSFDLTETTSIKIPHVKDGGFTYNDVLKSITFSLKVKTTSGIDENSLQISNIIYESISSEKLGELSKKEIKSNINSNIYNYKARDINYAIITLNPIIFIDNNFKRIVSFSYSFNNSALSNRLDKNALAVSNSVFKTGEWRRFYITKSGVYRLNKTFLREIGVNVDGDPRNIKIYGNGGRMIPLTNSVPYPEDIAENAIFFSGEQDGVFNDSDYILFYAEGFDNWNQENATHGNLYSDKSYYYINSSGTNGKRISTLTESTNSPNIVFDKFDQTLFHEVDRVNLVKLGRKWFGEDFKVNNQQNFDFVFPNLDTTSPLSLKVQAAGVSTVNTLFNVKINGQAVGNLNLSAVNTFGGPTFASENTFSSAFNSTSSTISIGLDYLNNGVPSSNGYLDYIDVKAKSFLRGYGKQYRFTVDAATSSIGTCEYQINNASSIGQIWDITDIYNVTSKTNIGLSQITFKAFMGQERKYIVVDNADFYSPIKEANSFVSNQDLKGTVFQNTQGLFEDVDYLIVTPASLFNEAEKLARFHRSYSQLNVKVATLESIYQEFCSGKQDIGAIRNFVKYIYNNASAPSERIKYVCLFGEASYDFKNRIPNNTNVVPIFHALNSFSVISTFMSDDYFGLMDFNEGNMLSPQGIDVAVGRILCANNQEADQMVNKVINYHDKESYGRWRNNIVMISDDSDAASDRTIQLDLNNLTDNITSNKPFINAKKIHADSYLQETTSGGQKYPKVREEFVNAFEQGALLIDYFGHGGEDGLAAERIFETTDATNLNNKYRYPLFVTVTCEFTRFDNPSRPTTGEFVFKNPNGGAVAMVTTTRQIGQSTGSIFNQNLGSNLFAYGSNNYPSIAEAVRLTKTNSLNSGNNVVFYLGDPALKLAIPKPKVRLTEINDVSITQPVDTLKALSFIKITGEVVDEFDTLLTNYNGELAVNIFDKEINRTTLGNDNTPLSIMPFTTLGETIFRGNASISGGKFEFSFVVPKDIKIAVGNGKISFYAKNNSPLQDQSGYDFSIKVGDVNLNAVADATPPKIRIYMNDETFVSGGTTNESPLFLAFLEDEHGINTASGIGHDIVAYLDGDETKPYVLNDFYETELNNYKKGKLKFPFRNLALGLHTLTFKAWDVYNNVITADLQFIVVGDDTLTLTNVLNYPNPFVNHTEFWFSHNRPFEPLEVLVQVFTITGKVVWSKNQVVTNNGFLSRDLTWDGKDDFGDKIGKGVYVYKLTVKSTLTNKKTEKIEKLVIL